MKQFYNVTGLTVAMESYGRTLEQSVPYLIEDEVTSVDIAIESSWPKVKDKYPTLSDDDGEYLATGANFYKQLLNYDGLMLHASAVVVDGNAYLFTADCGTGKSTHTQQWLKLFGDQAYILNDDKPALRLIDGRWFAFGTPWSGKNDISVNIGVPVAGIAVLTRGETNKIAYYEGLPAVQEIIRQVNRPSASESRVKLMELLDKLITQIPIWKLTCNISTDAAAVAYNAMHENAAK